MRDGGGPGPEGCALAKPRRVNIAKGIATASQRETRPRPAASRPRHVECVPDQQAARRLETYLSTQRRLETYLSTQRRLESSDPWGTAVAAARLYGACRSAGLTVRSTVDCWIAQLVIEHGAALLHRDRDFEHNSRVAPEPETFPAEFAEPRARHRFTGPASRPEQGLHHGLNTVPRW
jgi:hypothetical protein